MRQKVGGNDKNLDVIYIPLTGVYKLNYTPPPGGGNDISLNLTEGKIIVGGTIKKRKERREREKVKGKKRKGKEKGEKREGKKKTVRGVPRVKCQ